MAFFLYINRFYFCVTLLYYYDIDQKRIFNTILSNNNDNGLEKYRGPHKNYCCRWVIVPR